MIALYKDPEGKNVFKRLNSITTGTHLDSPRNISNINTTRSESVVTMNQNTAPKKKA